MSIKTLSFLLVSFLFLSNQCPAQNNEPDTCLYEINENETNKMIEAYKLYFEKNGLISDFYFSKCIIKAMADFVNANSDDVTGIRFFWGSKGNVFGNHKSRLIIVVTKKPSAPPQAGEKYPNDYNAKIPLPSGCAVPNNVYFAGANLDAKKWVDNFGEKFRGEPVRGRRDNASKDPLSLGVWLSSCKIDAMNKVLEADSNLDGMSAFCAAYYKSDDMYDNGDRPYAVQSTLLFIPTVNGVVNWKVLKNIYGLMKTTKSAESYNHGSLCPQLCN